MLLTALQHSVVGCRFVFVVVGLNKIFSHGMPFEIIPHHDAPHVGVPLKDNAKQIKDFSLLKFRTAPNRRRRRQGRHRFAIGSPKTKDEGAHALVDGIKVVDRL